MYLRALTARGFKSFADKVTLDFEPGISVIVGPNGSGKSNVADAVLWVLGEQSPRNLRGSKMEDVIFAGSANRQALNMAEVSLSFDNRDGNLPIDFPEVVVTRRLFRTGESEYMLNKTPCRLVDIQEMLSDLGIGRELTAVIGQNRLETILQSRSEDRRAFIEEAAGLRKHRRRKDKALRKMEGMERNLLRVQDIMSEVKKQLRPLERQAKQAREYHELVVESNDLSIRILVSEMQDLKGQWDNRKEEEERLLGELRDVGEGIGRAKERLTGLEAEIRESRSRLEECRLREMRLLALGERLRACQRLGEERIKLYAALAGEVGYGDAGWRTRREDLSRRKKSLEDECNRTEAEIEGLELEERKLGERRKALSAESTQARKERDSLRRSLAEAVEKAEEGRKALQVVWDKADEHRGRIFELELERKNSLERLRVLEEERRVIEEELSAIGGYLSSIEEKKSLAGADLARFQEELEAITRKQGRSFQDEALVVARLRALQEVFSSRLDYASAAARILEAGDVLPGILGMLLHKVRISEDYERAIESYLGPWLFCVITRNLEDAVGAIKLLKKEEAGYGVFLPLSEIPAESLERMKELCGMAGGTPALDAVESEEEIRAALEYLLGDVVLCDSLEEAESRAEVYPKLTFLTREGDVIAPRRVVKGGARPRSPFHIIAKRREIEQLQEMLDLCDEESMGLEVQRKSVLSTINRLEEDLSELASEDGENRQRLRELELASKERELQVAHLEADAAEFGKRIEGLRQARSELREKAIALDAEISSESGIIAALDMRSGVLEERLRSARAAERSVEEAQQELRAGKASLIERRFHLEERIKELEGADAAPSPPGREELADKSRIQAEMQELISRLMVVHEGLAGGASSREEGYRRELAEKESEQEGLRKSLEEMERREGELRELAHNRDLATAQLKMKVDMLVQRLLEEHKLPIETALSDYLPESPVEEMRERLEYLQRRREMLGTVNLRATEEYNALKERHDFLMEQVEDLRESKSSLLKVIRAIDREIVRIFKETYEEVNQHFQVLFERLFPQGRAELALSDPTDLLNTGVEIEAQPRGKRLKKLSLLSGGETALTSLAFLFAIFKTRPSPFYFLDEVEAALDDVNLHRFLNMLMEFKGDSQLIVITHQKRTMEIADVLYGMSMQANGVSKVISQKLEEAQQLAKTGTA